MQSTGFDQAEAQPRGPVSLKLANMFGSKDSFRRQLGPYDATRLPSVLEMEARAVGSMSVIDTNRRNTLGALLADRTGVHPLELWDRMSGGCDRMNFNRLAEALAGVGAGIMGHREMGILQACLHPRPGDGSVSQADWERAFEGFEVEVALDDFSRMKRAGVPTVPLAGGSSSFNNNTAAALPSMRHELAPTPAAVTESINYNKVASKYNGSAAEQWPGGWNKPNPEAPPMSPFAAASPTYKATAHHPPYGTVAAPAADEPTFARRRPSYSHTATWQRPEEAQPAHDPYSCESPTYMTTTSTLTSPFAQGGAWASN